MISATNIEEVEKITTFFPSAQTNLSHDRSLPRSVCAQDYLRDSTLRIIRALLRSEVEVSDYAWESSLEGQKGDHFNDLCNLRLHHFLSMLSFHRIYCEQVFVKTRKQWIHFKKTNTCLTLYCLMGHFSCKYGVTIFRE